jgi:hypothetical protein
LERYRALVSLKDRRFCDFDHGRPSEDESQNQSDEFKGMEGIQNVDGRTNQKLYYNAICYFYSSITIILS